MAIRKTMGDKIFDGFNIIILSVLMLSTLYPLLYVAFASLSEPSELVKNNGFILSPQGFSLDAYKAVLKNRMILSGYTNTIFYVLVGTTYNILMTSMGAYILSRKKFFLKKYIMIMVVITMFFGGGLIPNYLLIDSLGLMGSRWALIIPGAISTWNLIVMRTSFMGIPESLEESAWIDGANDIIILFRIVLPLSLPVIAVMILYYGVGHWNAWFNAMIYLRKRELYPLQLVLREIIVQNSTDSMMQGMMDINKEAISETIKYSTIMVATLPILASYPFLQKYFVKGVMIGALKG